MHERAAFRQLFNLTSNINEKGLKRVTTQSGFLLSNFKRFQPFYIAPFSG